jgi:hypothetical protein
MALVPSTFPQHPPKLRSDTPLWLILRFRHLLSPIGLVNLDVRSLFGGICICNFMHMFM